MPWPKGRTFPLPSEDWARDAARRISPSGYRERSWPLLALLIDLSKVVAISTFALLFYYGFANISAWRLKAGNRLYPRFVPMTGAASCLALLVFLLFASTQAWIIGVAGLTAGIAFFAVNRWLR